MVRNGDTKILKAFVFQNENIYHSKRRENVCTVKSLHLTAHSHLESELRCSEMLQAID